MSATDKDGVLDDETPKATRLEVRVSRDAYEKLALHSIMSGEDKGQIVDRLIREHLYAWQVVPDDGKVTQAEQAG